MVRLHMIPHNINIIRIRSYEPRSNYADQE
jgi:hypothetical protein